MGIITDTIITTCTCTKYSTEDVGFLCISLWKNGESSAVDSNGAISIERINDCNTILIATSCTATIKLRDFHISIVTFFRVNENIRPTHISVVWEVIRLTIVCELEWLLVTEHTIYHTSYITALYDNIHIGIHCSLMRSSYDTTIIVGMEFIICIIPFPININGHGTLDRHIWCTHQTVQSVIAAWLSSCNSNTRIMPRLQRNAEAFLTMRHCILHSLHIQNPTTFAESWIIIQTTINLERSRLCTINSTIARSIARKSSHLNTFTHLKVMILTEQITWVLSSCIVVECDILKTSVAKKAYIFHTITTIFISLNSSMIINVSMLSCNSYIFCKMRVINLFLPRRILLWRGVSLKISSNGEAFITISLIAGSLSVTCSYQDYFVLIPWTVFIKQTISLLPCLYRSLVGLTICVITACRICHTVYLLFSICMQKYDDSLYISYCQFCGKRLFIFRNEILI